MITPSETMRCTAFLELARHAIDQAELKLVGLPTSVSAEQNHVSAYAMISVASRNLQCALSVIEVDVRYREKQQNDGATADAAVTGKPVAAEPKAASD